MKDIAIKMAFIVLMLGAILQGCGSDAEKSSPESPAGHGVTVWAGIAKHTYTREYQSEGTVEKGKYYLSYPDASNTYTLAVVDFDKEAEVTPGLGLVTTLDGVELKWNLIGGSTVNFYLDNVSNSFGTGPEVTFTEAENPFKAGLFDDVDGSNDLLWGELSVSRNTRSLGFDLHHYMSRLKVQVKVAHSDNSVEDIDLTEAKVRITNLYTTPTTYNRKDGSLGFSEDQERESILVADKSENGYDWKEIIDSDENPDTTTYISQDIVLPPQSIPSDAGRPSLEIELSNGELYSGILPHTMLIAGSGGQDNSLVYPVVLSFLKEYILTIRTVITEEPPELQFMPIWVVDWVDKGEYTLESHQSGIYTYSDFNKLIGYYSLNNEYQLVRYGYLYMPEGETNQQWFFNFFSSVTLDFNTIFNSMTPGVEVEGKGIRKNFVFSFNNYAVYVSYNEDDRTVTKQVTQSQLYQIVTGNLTWQELQ